ncbi:hypothetical protein SAMN04487980_102010 [Streptomyces sp. cf124]|nr:hypothetical protein SAMN04487980_102010 [Streptomyces sp. cf124]
MVGESGGGAFAGTDHRLVLGGIGAVHVMSQEALPPVITLGTPVLRSGVIRLHDVAMGGLGVGIAAGSRFDDPLRFVLSLRALVVVGL